MAHQPWLAWLPLVAVTLLALGVNAWGLSQAGYGNTYYAAAVRSMTESWHNFFFVAFDPGGFITVDKPPVFLWIDALSARVFGYSSLALLLPSALAGAAAVALVWLVMRRYFGVLAATIAALVLALTPISVAVNRLNLPEPFLLLALIGAAACILRALDSKPWLWWAISAGLLVGVAFNTKMLVGWVPGPALALALVVSMRGDWWKAWQEWVPRLAVFGTVALAASVSWMLIVDNWPDDRPYIGGSMNDSVYDLALGYNGFGRVEGEVDVGGRPQRQGFTTGTTGTDSRSVLGAGGIIAGEPGALRLFDEANGGQIAWFLPFALLGGALSLWRWRSDHVLRAAVVLWLGWVLLYGVVFSYSEGTYHAYYTSALAPGVAALAGMSSIALAELVRRNQAWLIAGVAIAATTLYVQLVVAGRLEDFYEWVTPFTVVSVVAGVALTVASTWYRRLPVACGVAVVVAGLLLIPAAWSSYETANVSANTTLPQAGPRNSGAASRSFGSEAFDEGTAQLASWLQANRDPSVRWDLVVASAQNASTLMAEYDLSVMAIGGFSGSDPTITAAEFGKFVASGDVRYVLAPGQFRSIDRYWSAMTGFADAALKPTAPERRADAFAQRGSTIAGASTVMTAVLAICEPVTDRSLSLRFAGALYDCTGSGGPQETEPLRLTSTPQ